MSEGERMLIWFLALASVGAVVGAVIGVVTGVFIFDAAMWGGGVAGALVLLVLSRSSKPAPLPTVRVPFAEPLPPAAHSQVGVGATPSAAPAAVTLTPRRAPPTSPVGPARAAAAAAPVRDRRATAGSPLVTLPFPRKAVSLAAIAGGELTPLLLAAVVNPMGPTVVAVVVTKSARPGAPSPVLRLQLNPFSVKVEQVAELPDEPNLRMRACVEAGVAFYELDGAPTLVRATGKLRTSEWLEVLAKFLREFPDAFDVWRRIQKFPGNPWDRIEDEMEDAMNVEALISEHKVQLPFLSEVEAAKFARTLCFEDHWAPELGALYAAWQGAIDHATVNPVLSKPAFKEIYKRLVDPTLRPGPRLTQAELDEATRRFLEPDDE
jgi:hypothetical protein